MESKPDMESSLQPPISISEEPQPSLRRAPRPPSLPHASYPARAQGSLLAPHQPPGPGSARSRMSHRAQPNPGLLQTINKLEAESENRAYELINLRTLVLKVEKEREDALARCQRLTTANNELQEDVTRLNEELSELRRDQTSHKVAEWLDGASGLSHVLAHKGGTVEGVDGQAEGVGPAASATQNPSSTQQQQQLLQAAEQEINELRQQLQQLQSELGQAQARASPAAPVANGDRLVALQDVVTQSAALQASGRVSPSMLAHLHQENPQAVISPSITQLLPDAGARLSPSAPGAATDTRTSRHSSKKTPGLIECMLSIQSRKEGQQWTTLQELSRQASHKSSQQQQQQQQPDIVPELQGALAKVTADREEQAALRMVEVQHLKYTHAQALKERDSEILGLKQELAEAVSRAQHAEALAGMETSSQPRLVEPSVAGDTEGNTAAVPVGTKASVEASGIAIPFNAKGTSQRFSSGGACAACLMSQQAVQQLQEAVESLKVQLEEKTSQSVAAAHSAADFAAQLAGAHAQLADVQGQAQKAVRSAADLAAQLANMEQQQATADSSKAAAELEAVQEALSLAKAEVEQLQMTVTLSRAAQTDAQAQHMQADADRAKAEEALEQARADCAALVAERNGTQQQLMLLQQLLKDKDAELVQTTQQLQASQQTSDSQQQQASSSIQEKELAVQAMQASLAALEAQVATAQADVSTAKRELSVALEQLAACQAELTSSKVHLADKEAALGTAAAELAAAKAELSAAQLQFEMALQASDQKQLVVDLQEQIAGKVAALATAQRQVADLQAQLQGCQEQLQQKEVMMKGLEAELSSKVADTTQLQADMASKDEQVADKVAAMQDLNGQLAITNSNVTALQGQLAEAVGKVPELQAQLEGALREAKRRALAHAEAAGLAGAAAAYCRQQTAALNTTKEQLLLVTQERDLVQQELQSQQVQILDLQAQLTASTAQADKLHAQLQAQQCTVDGLLSQVTESREQLKSAADELTAARSQAAELQSKATEAQQELSRLTSAAAQQQAANDKQVAALTTQLQQLQQNIEEYKLQAKQQQQHLDQQQGLQQQQQVQQGTDVPTLELSSQGHDVGGDATSLPGGDATSLPTPTGQDTANMVAARDNPAQHVAALGAARSSESLSSRSTMPRVAAVDQGSSDTAVLSDQGHQAAIEQVSALEAHSKQLVGQLDAARAELQALRTQHAATQQQLQLTQSKIEHLEAAESARQAALTEAQAGLVAREQQAAGLKSKELAAHASKMMHLIRDMAAQMAYLQTQLWQQSQLGTRLAQEMVAVRADADAARRTADDDARQAAAELGAARDDANRWRDSYDGALRDMSTLRQRFNESERKLAAARARMTQLVQSQQANTANAPAISNGNANVLAINSGLKPARLSDAVRASASGTDVMSVASPASPQRSPPRSRPSDGLTPRGVLDSPAAGLLVAPSRAESMAVYKKLRHLASLYQLDLGASLYSKQHKLSSAGNATSSQLWSTLNAVLSALLTTDKCSAAMVSVDTCSAPSQIPQGWDSGAAVPAQHSSSMWAQRRQGRTSSPAHSRQPSHGSSPRLTPNVSIPSPTAVLARRGPMGRPESAPAGHHAQALARKRATDSVLGVAHVEVAPGQGGNKGASVVLQMPARTAKPGNAASHKLPLLSST